MLIDFKTKYLNKIFFTYSVQIQTQFENNSFFCSKVETESVNAHRKNELSITDTHEEKEQHK